MRAERVLVVTDEMEVGGSQRQIVHLLRGLKARGLSPELVYFRKPSHLLEALVAEGIPATRIDKRGAIDPAFVMAFRAFLRNGRFDVVHAFSITAELWSRVALLGLRGPRLVASVRGLGLVGPEWQWLAKRWILAGAGAVISNSRAGAALVARRCGIDPADIDIVPNGLDLPPLPGPETRAAARRSLGYADARPLVLFVGRLVAEKNLGLLVAALARMAPERRPRVWLAGEGPERPSIEGSIAREGLQDVVTLLGERADTGILMDAADLLVLPSSEEGLSNVLLEAMGHGLPVVATAVGGTPELVDHGEDGWLVPSGDASALCDAFDLLLDDAGLRQSLGRQGRAKAEARFALGAMVEATRGVYDRCLAGMPA